MSYPPRSLRPTPRPPNRSPRAGGTVSPPARWAELEELLAALERDLAAAAACALLRACAHLARREFAAARAVLAQIIARRPREVAPRLLLAHVHLQEERDPAAAEAALLDVLALDPRNDEALRCLISLHRRLCLQSR